MARAVVRPVGSVEMELGGGRALGLLDQDLVVPEAQGHTGERLGQLRDAWARGQRGKALVALPDVDQLRERLALVPLRLHRRRELDRRIAVRRDLVGGEDARNVDEAVAPVSLDDIGWKHGRNARPAVALMNRPT